MNLHERVKDMLADHPMIDSGMKMVKAGTYLGDSIPVQDEEASMREALDESGGLNPDLAYVTAEGVGVINVSGVLLNDGTDFDPGSFTTYGAIRVANQAMESSLDVKAIVYDISSGGGACSGCFELCDEIASNVKPTAASVGTAAYSAAYAIASSCRAGIWVSKTSGTGSVGVVAVHTSFEELLNDVGIEVTLLHAGDRKVDMNPFKNLSEDAIAEEMTQINYLYDMFVDHVADNRERLTAEAIKATQARTFIGSQGLDNGFADHAGSLVDAVHFAGNLAQTLNDSHLDSPLDLTESLNDSHLDAQSELSGKDSDYVSQVMAELDALGMQEQMHQVIKARVKVADIKEFVGYNAEVQAMCSQLGMAEKAEGYLASRKSMTEVKRELLQFGSNDHITISNTVDDQSAFNQRAGRTIDAGEIYARRRANR